MRLRNVAVAVAIAMMIAADCAAARADSAVPAMIVRVYDSGTVSPHVKAQSLDVARQVLGHVVRVSWKDCSISQRNAACDAPAGSDFIVRLVQSSPPHHRRRELPLGDTFVDTGTHQAVLATVYVDRVENVSAAAQFDTARLLGYAIAHEVGHLLLASTAHSASGLMRPVWREDELGRGDPEDWKLTPLDAAAIARRLMPPHEPVRNSRRH